MTLALSITKPVQNGATTRKRGRSQDETAEQDYPKRKIARIDSVTQSSTPSHASSKETTPLYQQEPKIPSSQIPVTQNALLLHSKRSPYVLTPSYDVPKAKHANDEVLIKIQTIGLNPIDWKAPDYGFGIPVLPYVAGRDFVGVVLDPSDPDASKTSRRINPGDVVFTASTDYRDLRKAAYQEYAVAPRCNLCRLPSGFKRDQLAGLGVAFVAAVLAMGVNFGVDFSVLDEAIRGPNLKKLLRKIDKEKIPEDVRDECLEGISSDEPRPGDWIAIWGGSSATASIIAQLAKLLGLRVIKVVDIKKHGRLLSVGPADLLVDAHDPERAIEVIRSVTEDNLRFGVDTIGKQTAEYLQRTLHYWDEEQPDEIKHTKSKYSHLVGLTGLPKQASPGVKHHVVPIKIHHEIEEIGEALMTWLEALLTARKLTPPEVVVVKGGLESVNDSLDRMRRGEISGKRLVVKLS